ncbi:3-oxoacyl-[acyl-carrier protein] reductase [Sphaerotilus hippei]|uniref:3-oxoacyl-[acyl-carrier protein] reductase n=1 Tax=Sphaerotilus hippei TaxID=744406 RepID=A0A318H2G5_9BURK|nr:SDR family oxidoreductase [Sphaerotilus hippei]PXW97548.1 3-oxoacyl-[acyl-carrier protein] reductase [Sphaerotilus hippei]
MNSLNGQVAVVTGGAGGLGEAICIGLAQAGCAVVVGYHSSEGPARALAGRLPPAALPHAALRCPVTDSAALAALAVEVGRRYGRCDLLVNCAGTTRFVPHGDLDALDDALIDQILATNVRGPIAAVRALRPLLAAPRTEGGTGLVVNISSIAAVTAMGSNIAYCASKAAVDNLTKSLARALAPAVRVLSVSPGLADTEFVKSMDVGWRDEQAGRTPLQRLALPEEVAAAVVAAATHLTFTTGAVIPVDGGRPLA